MSDQRPFPDEHWDDLPLPDGDKAWQRMELLLDEDKRRRRVIPWWIWRRLAPAVMLAALAIGGWLWLEKDKTQEKQYATPAPGQTATAETTPKPHAQPPLQTKTNAAPATKQAPAPTALPTVPAEKAVATPEKPAKETAVAPGALQPRRRTEGAGFITESRNEKLPLPKPQARTPQTDSSLREETDRSTSLPGPVVTVRPQDTVLQTATGSAIDSTAKKDSVTIKAAPPVAEAGEKKKARKKSSLVWSAGIGLQRSIALHRRDTLSADGSGKSARLADAIPSVYVRVQKGRWYAQGEFQYRVLQPVKGFSFSQKTTYDAALYALTTQRLILREVYYHQLPFSLNYFLLPQWSVGVGGSYNVLARTVMDREENTLNVQTGSVNTGKDVVSVNGYTDSFLYKTTAGVLLQTDYHWKRFSLGLRYTQNLQPFIKYTKPDGAVLDEKNRVLQAVLRFRLF